MRRITATGALFLALGGCATSPMRVSEARPVQASERYAIKSQGTQDPGRLTIFRDDGFVGSGCDAVFQASFVLPAGEENLGTGLAESGLCSGVTIKTVAANIKPRKEVIYRINWDTQGFYLGPYFEFGR